VSMACKKNSRQQIRSPHPLPLRALLLCCNYKACRGGGAVALCAVGWWEKMLFMHNCHVVTSPAMWPKQFHIEAMTWRGMIEVRCRWKMRRP